MLFQRLHLFFLKKFKSFPFTIQKGIRHGSSIVIANHGHIINGNSGDLNLIIHIAKHNTFNRVDNNLIYNKTITLKEALTGFILSITHISGKLMRINVLPTIQPGDTKEYADYGIVSGNETGSLIVIFDVILPKLNEQQLLELDKIFD